MLDTINNAWGWTGLVPAEVIYVNSFGNLIVKATDGAFWRISPEELKCEKIAADFNKLAELWQGEDFRLDWEMTQIVAVAEKKLGRLQQGRCYCFKLSPVVGGKYDATNFGEISLAELIAFSGDFAKQVKDVLAGGQIEIKIIP
jgi:hypothetical protein